MSRIESWTTWRRCKYDCANLPQSRLNELVRQLNSRAESLVIASSSGYEIRAYNHNLYIVKPEPGFLPQETYHFSDSTILKVDKIELELDRESIFQRLNQKDTGQSIMLKFRIACDGSNPDIHRLKRLFQKHKIPPWKRSLTPQVYLDDELTGLWF